MQLIDVLDERIIDLNAEATNKDEVLTLLAGKLKDAGYIHQGVYGTIHLTEAGR